MDSEEKKHTFQITLDDGSEVSVTWTANYLGGLDHFAFRGPISETGYRSDFVQINYESLAKARVAAKARAEKLHREELNWQAKEQRHRDKLIRKGFAVGDIIEFDFSEKAAAQGFCGIREAGTYQGVIKQYEGGNARGEIIIEHLSGTEPFFCLSLRQTQNMRLIEPNPEVSNRPPVQLDLF